MQFMREEYIKKKINLSLFDITRQVLACIQAITPMFLQTDLVFFWLLLLFFNKMQCVVSDTDVENS